MSTFNALIAVLNHSFFQTEQAQQHSTHRDCRVHAIPTFELYEVTPNKKDEAAHDEQCIKHNVRDKCFAVNGIHILLIEALEPLTTAIHVCDASVWDGLSPNKIVVTIAPIVAMPFGVEDSEQHFIADSDNRGDEDQYSDNSVQTLMMVHEFAQFEGNILDGRHYEIIFDGENKYLFFGFSQNPIYALIIIVIIIFRQFTNGRTGQNQEA